jgi:nucleoside-diphosphate-sugar epimerase
MKILITGCAGRVGEAVTKHLLAQEFDIRDIDIANSFDGNIEYHRCDLLDADALGPHI